MIESMYFPVNLEKSKQKTEQKLHPGCVNSLSPSVLSRSLENGLSRTTTEMKQ